MYQYHARLDLENFAFVPLPRVPLARAAELRKFCFRTTNTRGRTWKILRSYHYHSHHYHAYHLHARLELENFDFVQLPRALLPCVTQPRAAERRKFCVRINTTRGCNEENFAFVPLPRVPLTRASGVRKFCDRTTTTRTTTSVQLPRAAGLRKFCVRTNTTRGWS